MAAIDKTEEIVTPIVNDMGYDLVRLRLTGGSRYQTLQVMIEKKDRSDMTLEDCEEVSRMLSATLDVEDPISSKYVLEVSSPGLDRPLVKLEDYERFKGREAKIELFAAIDGEKKVKGVVLGVSRDGKIEFENEEGKKVFLLLDQVAKAKLLITDDLMRSLLSQDKKEEKTKKKAKAEK